MAFPAILGALLSVAVNKVGQNQQGQEDKMQGLQQNQFLQADNQPQQQGQNNMAMVQHLLSMFGNKGGK
jgi:hypothetical protein